MRLIYAAVFASLASGGTVNASSVVILGNADQSSPSSVMAGTPDHDTGSVIKIGVPAIDSGKVSAVDSKGASAPMVMRGGEFGSASAEPATLPAPSSKDSAGAQRAADVSAQSAPVPVSTE